MTPGNNPYTLNKQGLFPSEIAEKSLSDGKKQYFTPPCTKETSKNLWHSELPSIKETPIEKSPFNSIHTKLHSKIVTAQVI